MLGTRINRTRATIGGRGFAGNVNLHAEYSSERRREVPFTDAVQREHVEDTRSNREGRSIERGANIGCFAGGLIGTGVGGGVGALFGAVIGCFLPGPGTTLGVLVGAAVGAGIGAITCGGACGGVGTSIGAVVAAEDHRRQSRQN